MGTIKDGVYSGYSGQVGPLVGAIVRGVATIRTRPKKSTKPAAASQVQQRTKFGLATNFIFPLKSIVDVGYQSYTKKMSASNAAVRDLLDNAITGVASNFKIDYPNVELSKGRLPEALTLAITPPIAGSELIFTWSPAELGGKDAPLHAADRMSLVMYDEQIDRFLILDQVVARSAGTYTAGVPFLFAGHALHVWSFFVSPDGKSVSKSLHLGPVTPIR